jgi:hypothetical protein
MTAEKRARNGEACATNVSEIGSALTFEGEMNATALNNTQPTILITHKDPILGTF